MPFTDLEMFEKKNKHGIQVVGFQKTKLYKFLPRLKSLPLFCKINLRIQQPKTRLNAQTLIQLRPAKEFYLA